MKNGMKMGCLFLLAVFSASICIGTVGVQVTPNSYNAGTGGAGDYTTWTAQTPTGGGNFTVKNIGDSPATVKIRTTDTKHWLLSATPGLDLFALQWGKTTQQGTQPQWNSIAKTENKIIDQLAANVEQKFDLRFQSPTDISNKTLTETQFSTITISVIQYAPPLTTYYITITPPESDATINRADPNWNIGSWIEILTWDAYGDDPNNTYRGLIKFDLSNIPSAAIIVEAKLRVFCTAKGGASPFDVTVHRILQPNWTELGVTWNKYDGVNSWITPGGDFDAMPMSSITPPTNNWGEWDITSEVQYAIGTAFKKANILLKLATEDSTFTFVSFYSKEAPSNLPELKVKYLAP